MNKTKNKTIIISLFLAMLLGVSILLPNLINPKNQLVTRDVNVNAIGTMSYEEKAEQIVSVFDDYSINTTDSNISFDASIDMSLSDLTGYQFLSTSAEETIKTYKTDLDLKTETFYITTQYIQDGEIILEETTETVPYYDAYEDDYYVAMPDGTNVSISETLTPDNLDECLVGVIVIGGVAITAAEAAILLAAVVIIASPTVQESIVTVVTQVVTWVKSFFRWFKSILTKKTTTVVSTAIVTTFSYSLSIGDIKVEALPYSKDRTFEVRKYYAAIADTDDDLLYVTSVPLNDLEALAILTSSTYVSSVHSGSSRSFVISLYTVNSTDAGSIAVQAGTILGSPGAIHHNATKIGYFNHYHPGETYTSLSHPHVFYGSPLA